MRFENIGALFCDKTDGQAKRGSYFFQRLQGLRDNRLAMPERCCLTNLPTDD
ncbi:hypothetical protein [Trichlorobacter thiogenes]|uniref:hypothetical protein n=1 Tax=Trichlorobacter thiogenes TaxID=115783 RepID=UPI001294788E|nr:hypothetical protein [Trichlorobacter thiogenes]